MDLLGMSDHNKPRKTKKEGKRRSSGKNGLKVVYISSPMKVKTSASDFRAIVQELTGRDSDVARFMDGTAANDLTELPPPLEEKDRHDPSCGGKAYYDYYAGSGNFFPVDYGSEYNFESESPTESDSFVERFDANLFSMPHVERSFRENHFPYASRHEAAALLDVLN